MQPAQCSRFDHIRLCEKKVAVYTVARQPHEVLSG